MFGIFKNLLKEKDPIITPKEIIEEPVTKDDFHYYIENDKEVRYPLYVGSRIISVSNQINSLQVGEIIGFDRITQGRNIVPLVRFDGDDTPRMCLSILIPYDDDMYNVLKDLDERNDMSCWNYVSPSWTQSPKGEIFKETRNSVFEEFRNLDR